MTVRHEPLMLPEDDSDYQLDSILSFLSLVHPYLNDPDYRNTCVELRPVPREGKSYQLSKSIILWDLGPESIIRLSAFLKKLNGYPVCLFYSVYSFDNHRKVLTRNGKYRKGTIHSDNAVFACEVALDFDHITESEQNHYNEILHEAGIYPMWVFSGHGYQAHILLDERMYEADGLKRFVRLFYERGFPVDLSCTDSARLMRLPFTYNCKNFAEKDHPERLSPVLCEIEQYSMTRYSISELKYLIEQIPISASVPDETPLTPLKTETKKEKGPAKQKPETSDIAGPDQIVYPYIDNYTIPEPIIKMLTYTPDGFRNKVLGFLIRYFRKHLYMSRTQIMEILSIWSQNACDPKIPEELFEDDFKRLYYSYNGLPYDADLAKEFGYIPFDKEIVLSKKDIAISNCVFSDFDILTGKHIRMYLAIRLLEHMDEEPTQESLSQLLGISVRAVRSTLKEILKTRHCYLVKGNSRRKIPDAYHSNRLYEEGQGCSIFTYNDLKCYVKELFEDKKRGNNELKLYLYMQYRFRNNEIFMSQANLGEALGLEQNSISEIASRLAEKGFLHIEKRPHENQKYFEKCSYTLLR